MDRLFWLLQSSSAHPALERGQPPPGLLAPGEEEEFARFTSTRRRGDWLLGRWTAKRLLQQIVSQHCGYDVPPDEIAIGTAKDGAPVTSFREPFTAREFSLSISHSQGYALCAVIEGRGTPVGVDLECVEGRPPDFAASFFNADEQALLGHRLRDTHVTAIWSAKEAALKAARVGLRGDPHQVSCLVKAVAVEPQDWIPFRIVWRPAEAPSRSLPKLTGWWQVLGDLVLTLAIPA